MHGMNIKVKTSCPTVRCVYISVRPVARWNATPLVSGRSQESKGHCTWHGLTTPGCGERFSKLITGCHVGFKMKPAYLLKFSGCS